MEVSTCANLKFLCNNLHITDLEISMLSDEIDKGLVADTNVKEYYIHCAETVQSRVLDNPDYAYLAGRLYYYGRFGPVESTFSEHMELFYDLGLNAKKTFFPLHCMRTIRAHRDVIDELVVQETMWDYTYFQIRTIEKTYLNKLDDDNLERPEFLFMRVAVFLNAPNIDDISTTFKLLSKGYYTHATPTLIFSGSEGGNLSSCFVLDLKEDTAEKVLKLNYKCGILSSSGGGVGLNLHCLRGEGVIAKNNLNCLGVVPVARMLDSTSLYAKPGLHSRPAAYAIYLEPWHVDIFEFLNLKRNIGEVEKRAPNLFYGLWIPDLFMRRVERGEMWSLMSSEDCPNLNNVYGEEFNNLYIKYESHGKFIKQVPARELWDRIVISQMETGTPYMLYKDACNYKTNHSNFGTIRGGNLCTEILQYHDEDHAAVCNLASISLPKFIDRDGKFDLKMLGEVTEIVIRNLNKVIDYNCYKLKEIENGDKRARALGLGVQGLADTFFKLNICFDSEKAKVLNRHIFETIYFHALKASCELSEVHGPYEMFKNSKASKGILQFDMWKEAPSQILNLNWNLLKRRIVKYGLRNSLLTAIMPTTSTSQLSGNSESVEPISSNLYNRRTVVGDVQIVNQYLIKKLMSLGLWTNDVKNKFVRDHGSIQNISCIPKDIKEVYKTVWEISNKVILGLARDRAPFIDQSQSTSLHLSEYTSNIISSIHFYAWRLGLKGTYYLRTKPASYPTQFTVDTMEDEVCESCSG